MTWPQVHAFRLTRHHLARRAPKKDLARVVGDIGGAQAQVMSAAEMQIAVRVECGVADVREALWKQKSLVKTWLMRGTLHLVPAADLPLFTAAMRTLWKSQLRNSWLTFLHLTEPEYWSIVDAIGEALDGRVLTRDDLIAEVGKGRSEHVRAALKSGWGGMLKPVARSGLLCFGPSQGQSVTFVRPREWLGSWREVDPDEALVEVARRYLRAFGPATKDDFASWWGNWPGVGRAAWAGLAAELVPVSIEGRRTDMLAADLGHINQPAGDLPIQLLPGFDPYVLGYKDRSHLVETAFRSRVSRTAGWISPVVIIEGRVAATWSHEVVKTTLRVAVEPFQRLPPKALPQIRNRADELAAAMGLTEADVKVA